MIPFAKNIVEKNTEFLREGWTVITPRPLAHIFVCSTVVDT